MRSVMIAVLVLSAAWLWAHAPATSAADGPETLVQSKCTYCHSADRICKQLGRKGSAEWDATVGKMIDKGAQVSAEEKPLVSAYLASARRESAALCGK